MSDESVRDWLTAAGLGQYADVFEADRIGVDVLPLLSDQDLKDLGVPLGDRRRLLAAAASRGPASPSSPAPATAPPPATNAHAERRQLTVLFCDMVGYTELASRLDPEVLQAIVRAYEDISAASITRYEGYVFQRLGDGIVAFFGYPLAHEGEAERAVRAGLAIVAALAAREVAPVGHLAVRIGIATGLVVVSSLEKGAVGEAMNLAARLQAIAQPGSVVVSEHVHRLAGGAFDYQDLGEQKLKGIGQPTHAFRILGVSDAASRFEAATYAGLTPLVGREQELGLLLERWQLAQDGEGQVVLLSGEPGIGKSRILSALRERLEGHGARSLRFQCSPYYVNSAFYPLIDNFERALRFGRNETAEVRLDKLEALLAGHCRPLADARFIASLLSVPCEERYGALPMTPHKLKEETLRALTDLVEAQARNNPCVMLFEDLHWADPSTLDALDALVERAQGVPLLMVLTHRPEFPARWSRHPHATALNLSKLTRAQSGALVSRIARDKPLPAELVERIVAKTDGVPLYVEELTRAILESGQLRDTGERYAFSGAAAELSIPATLRDSLMARLDRVMPVKEVAQIGASIGREFGYELLAAVAPMSAAALDDALERLTESGLAFRRGTPPAASYTFKHALVQDAAYDSLLKTRRQELHGKIARVIEERFPHIRDNEPEVLAHHYTEVGQLDRAVRYRLRAGERALGRTALPEAISQLQRVLQLLPALEASQERDTWELEGRIGLGSAFLGLRGWGAVEIEDTVQPALALAERLERMDRWLAACYLLIFHRFTTLHFGAARELATQAFELGQRPGLDTHALIGHGWLAWINGSLGNLTRALEHMRAFEALFDYQRHGDNATASDMKVWVDGWGAHYLWIMGWPDRAARALDACVEHARKQPNPVSLIFALAHGSAMLAYRREPQRMFAPLDEASRLARDNALHFMEGMLISIWRGVALMLSQHHGQGLETMRQATAMSLAANSPIMIPCHRLFTAQALAGRGRLDEAIELLDGELATIAKTGERLHEPDILRLRGDLTVRNDPAQAALAEHFLRRALELSRAQAAKGWELRAATSLARLWSQQGKREQALELLAPLYDWFTEGFDTPDLVEARALLGELRAA